MVRRYGRKMAILTMKLVVMVVIEGAEKGITDEPEPTWRVRPAEGKGVLKELAK